MEKMKKQNLWFLAGLLGIGMILFWRCFYSVNTTDEAYYIGTVYRLWFGDGMLCDEWNPTQQMCSFWLYPFYALFRLILGSNDGMILAFRLLYIVFQLFISGYMYGKLKKFGYISFFPIFFYLLSTAFNINSLSYNTMANSALAALLVTLVMMEKPDWKNCVWCGIFASIVVMGNPYAVFAYVLYGAACAAVTFLFKKLHKETPVSLQFTTFFKMSLTAAGVMAVFLLFTFWHATLERIVKNLPYIVGDQEHVQRWNVKISDYFRYFREHYLGAVIVPIVVSAIALFDKKRVKHGAIYMGLSVVSIFPYMIYHGLISDYVPINLVTVPICFLGVTAYVVSEKKLHRVFYIWYLPAMIYPFIVQITSNTGPLAVSAGFVTAGLDFRYAWLPLPKGVSIGATVVFLLSYALYAEVLRENTYLSRTIEVQEGQTVVDTGLYGIVRHPMYSFTVFLFLSMPLVLGSLYAFFLFLVYPIILAMRIKNEEEVLEEGLAGYKKYKQKVRYKMIPFIW